MDRSKAKSSAAKIRPDKYGEEAHMEDRSMRALADSIKASRRRGLDLLMSVTVFLVTRLAEGRVAGCLVGRVWRITSVTKDRSEADLTLGITMASRFGALSLTK